MQTFDDLSPVEMDPQNEDVIAFLSQVHGQPAGAEPTPEQASQALARVRQRLLTARLELLEVVGESERVPEQTLRLLETAHEPEEVPLPHAVSVLPAHRRGWQRRFSLLAASLTLMLVVGSMLVVFNLASPGPAGSGQQAVYAFTGGWLQKFDAQTGALFWKKQILPDNLDALNAANNGLVYVLMQQKLFAFKESDGSLLWDVSIDGTGFDKLIVDHTRLYVMLWKDGSHYDNHTSLEAFDALSGQRLWHYDHNGLYPNNFAVASDMVYGVFDLNPEPVTDNVHANSVLFALHATDGSEAWHKSIDDPSLSSVGGVLAVANDTLYITEYSATSYSPYLYAYNASNGAFVWRSPALQHGQIPALAEPYTDSLFFIGSQRVYIFTDGVLSALDEQNGRLLWKHAGGLLSEKYTLVGNTIFSGETHSDGNYIVALNALTGQITAQHRIGTFKPQIKMENGWTTFSENDLKFATMLVSPDITYVMSPDRHLLAFNNATGKQFWSALLAGTPKMFVFFALSE